VLLFSLVPSIDFLENVGWHGQDKARGHLGGSCSRKPLSARYVHCTHVGYVIAIILLLPLPVVSMDARLSMHRVLPQLHSYTKGKYKVVVYIIQVNSSTVQSLWHNL
jgi:hypothetical protein